MPLRVPVLEQGILGALKYLLFWEFGAQVLRGIEVGAVGYKSRGPLAFKVE